MVKRRRKTTRRRKKRRRTGNGNAYEGDSGHHNRAVRKKPWSRWWCSRNREAARPKMGRE